MGNGDKERESVSEGNMERCGDRGREGRGEERGGEIGVQEIVRIR